MKPPFHRFSGTRPEIGLALGRTLANQIRLVVQSYIQIAAEAMKTTADDGKFLSLLQELANRYKLLIEEVCPHFALEIKGIAEGSKLPLWQIYFINSRTEILAWLWSTRPVGECTVFGAPEYLLMGQTWDWRVGAAETLALVQLEPKHCPKTMMLVEPGVIGKFGINEHGVGLLLRILFGKPEGEIGLPAHILMRLALECSTVEEAESAILGSTRNSFSSLMLLDRNYGFHHLELNGSKVKRIVELNGTNHYRGFADPNPIPGSIDRLHRASHLAAAIRCINGMRSALTNSDGPGEPICRGPAPSFRFPMETAAAVVIDLNDRPSMHVKLRPANNTDDWEKFQL